jgi:UDP-N-acetylglucosamine:LPS N-acetylglucosamine transferase
MPKLDLIYFDAGGGHRAAATALKQSFAEKYPDWEVRLMHLQEELSSMDLFRQLFGIKMEDVYNLVLRKGWTLGSPQLLVAMHGLIRLYHPLQVRKLKEFWGKDAPDVAVSVVPNFNRAIYQALAAVSPKTKMVSVLTDLADYPPHFWIEKGQNQFFICGTAKAEEQALALGHARDKVFRVSGMVLNPRFYQPVEVDVAAERRKLGLDPTLPTALVMFGGYGSAVMARIAKNLDQSGLKLQLIFICGKSTKLKEQLTAMKLKMPHVIEGFTKEVPYYMKLSDFFIGKPGPGSISEAIHLGLPVVVTRNALTLPQERYNADWLTENGLGMVLKHFGEIVPGVTEMLAPGKLAGFQANARKMNNRAVFEIPEIIDKLLR